MKDFSRYDVAQVIADEFDLIVSDIIVGDFSNFREDFEANDDEMMNLRFNLEDKFDIKIPPEIEESWACVQDVYDFMEAQ